MDNVKNRRIWDTYCVKVPERYLKPTHILWIAWVMVDLWHWVQKVL